MRWRFTPQLQGLGIGEEVCETSWSICCKTQETFCMFNFFPPVNAVCSPLSFSLSMCPSTWCLPTASRWSWSSSTRISCPISLPKTGIARFVAVPFPPGTLASYSFVHGESAAWGGWNSCKGLRSRLDEALNDLPYRSNPVLPRVIFWASLTFWTYYSSLLPLTTWF